MSSVKYFGLLAGCVLLCSGCSSGGFHGNTGNLPSFTTPLSEAQWIRDGEPLEFEGQLWYPQDQFDVLLDSEVYLLGDYKGVQFFVGRVDVRPYNRLYTKFGRNKFRSYRKRVIDD